MTDVSVSIPEWVGQLATAVSRLSYEQLLLLASSFNESLGSGPSAAELQRKLSISATEGSSLGRSLNRLANTPGLLRRDLEIALLTLAQARSLVDARQERVDIVCTAPSDLGVPVRTTFAVAMEMVKAAREEIFLVGYMFTPGVRNLILQCAAARRDRRVRVSIVGNSMEKDILILKSLWPADSPAPDVFGRTRSSSDDTTSLHAKILICDRELALVTSANFTHHGMHENVEVGVKIQSASVPRLVEFVKVLMRTGNVQPVHWMG